jgi:membrane protease subunit HflC
MNRSIAILVGLGLLLLLAASAFFTVHQTQVVLVTRLGQPIRVISDPGLQVKLPFVETVITFDRRLLDYDQAGQEVILGDQRRLEVDSFTRYRITDPLRYYQATGGTDAGIRLRLQPIVASALRNVLGNETLVAVLSNDRARVMGEILRIVNDQARGFGLEVVDVRIRRADLPEGNTQAILSRMQSERERVARELRAEGAEAAQRVRGSADRERTVLIAEAQSQSEILRGEGEREAIRIFAEAFQRDPSFYQFYRTMQAYREAFSGGETRLVLSPDSEFFRFLRQSPLNPAAPAPPAAATPAPAPTPAPVPAPQ